MRKIFLILSCCFSVNVFAARNDSSGFAILGYQVKSKLPELNSLRNLKDPAPDGFSAGEGYGNKTFSNRSQGMIVRYSFAGKDLFEGSYTTTEIEAGFLLRRNDRDYYYRSYHSNDCLYYDRYIYDETRDELYFSLGQSISLPVTKSWKLSSGLRLSLQQSIYAEGVFRYLKSYKVKGTMSYNYNPDISDPDDIFGRPVTDKTHSGKLKASTGILAEVPLILAYKPFDRVSLIYEFRWGWGTQLISGTDPAYKKIFGMGIGLGYDFN